MPESFFVKTCNEQINRRIFCTFFFHNCAAFSILDLFLIMNQFKRVNQPFCKKKYVLENFLLSCTRGTFECLFCITFRTIAQYYVSLFLSILKTQIIEWSWHFTCYHWTSSSLRTEHSRLGIIFPLPGLINDLYVWYEQPF